MWPRDAVCDPAEIGRIDSELAKAPAGVSVAVGVIDLNHGRIRLFTFDETDAFSRANPALQVMAGHEAAAAMAAVPLVQARGFALGKQAGVWHLNNVSHLNQADGQSNTMQMSAATFAAVESALRAAGMTNLVSH